MSEQALTPWVFRRWRFGFPSELHPVIIERLRGLPARADEVASSLRPGRGERAAEGGWSITRHFGHLVDLELLFNARLDAYEQGVAELPAADMSNLMTVNTDHDGRGIAGVLVDLRARRMDTVARLEAYPRDFFGRSAWHGRLEMQKRVIDSCCFFADHDDHHMALIRLLLG